MPITDYTFENRIFFAKESGLITREDAQTWSVRLKAATEASETPIVALVDAMDVTFIDRVAQRIFQESSHFDNLLAVIVATNRSAALQSETIGLLGKRGYTRVLGSLEEATQEAGEILSQHRTASV